MYLTINKEPLVIRFVYERISYDVFFVSTPFPSFKNVIKFFMKIFTSHSVSATCKLIILCLPLITIYACFDHRATGNMDMESMLNSLHQTLPSRGALRKRCCSENMRQIYWRTPMLK